ncbi:hypothetical protein [Endozoicomonas sp. ONNA1]|uniref:hypothetical protein n=1 Tax=Endozoicomonas sp. ONNA1 TaxID=2828740 RepID=UPI0021498E21|nr:hypothetical protein [Endozoicomonas sp. ONNA1]
MDSKDKLKELAEQLKALEADDRFVDDRNLWLRNEDTVDKLYPGLNTLAHEVLIKQGKPNGFSMAVLEKLGFKIGPGETDSFGWLSGIIYTSKGKYVYG